MRLTFAHISKTDGDSISTLKLWATTDPRRRESEVDFVEVETRGIQNSICIADQVVNDVGPIEPSLWVISGQKFRPCRASPSHLASMDPNHPSASFPRLPASRKRVQIQTIHSACHERRCYRSSRTLTSSECWTRSAIAKSGKDERSLSRARSLAGSASFQNYVASSLPGHL